MSVLLLNATSAKIPLKAGSVHMIATSPPYYGLRDYKLPGTVWPAVEFVPMAGLPAVNVPAWEGCLGMEPDPLMFMAHVVHIMREGWRVLREDGVAWLNFGDSYSGYKGDNYGVNSHLSNLQSKTTVPKCHDVGTPLTSGLKQKDLMGIPWRIAFALQADGWYLRSDVIWSKDNPMPESVNGWRWERHQVKITNGRVPRHGIERGDGHVNESNVSNRQDGALWEDCPGCDKCDHNDGYVLRRGSWRPTKSHEYIFMLAKSEDYYSDREAVLEGAVGTGGGTFSDKYASNQPEHGGKSQYRWGESTADGEPTTRNKRSVWNVNPQPYPGAHFATWPPDLVETMLTSSTSEKGVCPVCGAPWVRVVERSQPQPRPDNPNPVRPYGAESGFQNGTGATTLHMTRTTETTDWRPSCKCPERQPVPAVVLDIFAGSGTTLQVARQLGRHGIGLDLSFTYLKNEARHRLSLDALEALQSGTGMVQTAGRRKKKTNSAQMGLL